MGAWLNRDKLSLRFNAEKAKEYIGYSLPFVVSGLVMQLSEVIGRWQIKHAFTDEGISMAMVGTYSIGNRISGFLLLLVNVFQLSWVPYLFNIAKLPNAKVIYANMLRLYLVGFGTVLFGIVLFRHELIAFFAPAYSQTYDLIVLLLFSVFIKSIQYVSTPGLILDKSSKHIAIAAFPSMLVNVVAGAILVHLIGLEGVAIGSLLGAIVWISYTTYHSQKKLALPFDVVFILRFVVLLFLLIALAYLFDYLLPVITVLSVSLKTAWFLLCAVAAYLYIRKRLWLGNIHLD